MEQQLDNLLLGELNRRVHKIRLFRAHRVKDIAKKLEVGDRNYIRNQCQLKGCDVKPYLKHYEKGVSKDI